ncbi:MAG TPA: PRC-barrel domain-containing protein [Chitinophagaceae bacterium]|nr:PRC-barrel domain-containing protein [Chitinophagaceae bacterium]
MDNMKHRRLQELDRSDFEIVRDEPDIRGWDVRGINGRKIGAVEELIVDAPEKKVRYMVVDLDDNELRLRHRKVLIPIGLAELDQKDDDVLIPNISPQQLGELPDYDRNNLTGDVERRIFSTLNSPTRPATVQEPRQRPVDMTKKDINEKDERKQRKEVSREDRKEVVKEERKERKEKEEHGEVDPDFYRHEYYNVDNLYKNRLHEIAPAKTKKESEYEKGLRIWERRSEGTVIPDENRREKTGMLRREQNESEREIDEKQRMEMIQNRRNNYQQRRYPEAERSQMRRETDEERTED